MASVGLISALTSGSSLGGTTSTKYLSLGGSSANIHELSNFDAASCPFRTAGELSGMQIHVRLNTNVTASWILALGCVDSGSFVAGTQTITIPVGLIGTFEDNLNTDTVTPVSSSVGTRWVVRATRSGGTSATDTEVFAVNFAYDTGGRTHVLRHAVTIDHTLQHTSTRWQPLAGVANSGWTDSVAPGDGAELVMPGPGTLRNPSMRVATNTRNGTSTWTLYVNGVATSVVITVGTGVTGWQYADTSVVVAANDRVSWGDVTGGTTGSVLWDTIVVEFEADTDVHIYAGGGSGSGGLSLSAPPDIANIPIAAAVNEDATPADLEIPAVIPFRVTSLGLLLGNATHQGILKLYVNGDLALTGTTTAAAASDDWCFTPTVSGVQINRGDLMYVTVESAVGGLSLLAGAFQMNGLSPTFAPCSGGGSVATASDPADGVALANATSPELWAVLHLDSGDIPVSWLPLADPLTYHGGHKEPRILSIGRQRRAMSDQFGGLQTSTITITLADHDRKFRVRSKSETLVNREISIWMADDATRRAQGQARRVGHYVITNYEPGGDMTFLIYGASFIGSEVSGFFSEALLDLPKYSREFVGTALPYALEGKVIPAHFGYIADDNRPQSLEGPVLLDATTSGFGGVNDGNFVAFGWGDLPGAEPVDLTLGEASGGSFDSTSTLYVMRTAVIGGVESNPYPLFNGTSQAITGTGKKLTMTGSAVTGATAYRWYVSDVPIGHTAQPRSIARVVETVGTSAELLGPDDGDVYVAGPPMWAVVVAIMADGSVTKPQRTLTYDTGNPQYDGFIQRMPFATRPTRIAWQPLTGATEYWVYVRGSTGGAYFGDPASFKTRFVVAADTNFLDYIPGQPGEPVDGLPGFELLKGGITLEYIGELDMPDGVRRAAFCAGVGALNKIHELFGSDGATPTPARVRVSDGLYGTTVFSPDGAGWPYPNRYVPLVNAEGEELWITAVFVDPAHAIAIAAINGTVPLTANICGLTDVADGTGLMIDSGIRQALHVLTQWGPREDGGWRSGAWKSIPTRNGVPIYRASSFEAVRTHFDLLCAWTLGVDGSVPRLFDFLASVAINLDVRWSENQHGQLEPHRLDESAASIAHFSDGSVLATTRANIPAHVVPKIVPTTTTLVNRLTYVFKRNYVRPITKATPAADELLPRENSEAPEWFSGDLEKKDDDSKIHHKAWKDERIEFSMHRTGTGPAWVIARLLQRWAWPRDGWSVPVSLLGLDVGIGAIVTLTHHAGASTNANEGAVNRRLLITAKELDASMDPDNASALDVWIEGEDISSLTPFASAGLQDETTMAGNLGDETSPLPPPTGAYPLGSEQ